MNLQNYQFSLLFISVFITSTECEDSTMSSPTTLINIKNQKLQ